MAKKLHLKYFTFSSQLSLLKSKKSNKEIENNKIFITNLGKCTQIDARPLSDVVLSYSPSS